MTVDATIWTEGKTDAKYLTRAREVLKFPYKLAFQVSSDMGDDQLLKHCRALAQVQQAHPTVFIFDRDNVDIVTKVSDEPKPYKSWGNNVFSFAIPNPDHRPDLTSVCIELYFSDSDLKIKDTAGRRIFLSSEFNLSSGRHLTEPTLSVAHKGKLSSAKAGAIRILDTEVYNASHQNVALSKSDFATNVANAVVGFEGIDFRHFDKIFSLVEQSIQTNAIDLLFAGMDDFIKDLSQLPKTEQLAKTADAAIRM